MTLFGISKTTINGVLAMLISILTPILSIQMPQALATPQASHTWLWAQFIVIVALAILRGVVGFLQNDATPTGH